MKLKLIVLLLAFVALSAFAAAIPESKMDKDKTACRAEADAAIRSTKMQHPGDVTKVQQVAYNKCMRGKSYAMPPIREK